MPSKNDPANYRKMSEPFENIQQANQALKDFYEAVEKARKEFRMMDVHVIVKMNVLRGDVEGSAITSAHYGNTLESAPMCAWALGNEQAEFEALLRESSKPG